MFIWICQCWPTSKNFNQLCVDTGCSLEDLSVMMDDREECRERGGERKRVREIHADSATR